MESPLRLDASERISILIVMTFIVLLGCEHNTPTMTIGLICYPTTLVSSYYTLNVKYGKDDKVSSIDVGPSPGESLVYTFDDQGNVSSYVHVEPCCSTKHQFVYDGQNRLIEEDVIQSGNVVKYQYNSTGQMISESNGHVTYSFEYPDGTTNNISKVRYSDRQDVMQFEYDKKPNPFKVLFPGLRTVPFPFPFSLLPGWITDNNVVKVIRTSTPTITPTVVDYVYKYNDSGYPTSSIPSDVSWTYICK
jgi:hypothetical protein